MKSALDDFRVRVGRAGGAPCRLFVDNGGSGLGVTVELFAEGHEAENFWLAERLAKSLLWLAGGARLFVGGCEETARRLQACYAPGGARAFDAAFMADVFGSFSVIVCSPEELPAPRPAVWKKKEERGGCRLGLDAGATNLKVCAVQDGRAIYADTLRWTPAIYSHPGEHRVVLVAALKRAAAHLPRLDGIGVSTAGIVRDNRLKVSSLLRGIDWTRDREEAETLFSGLAETFGVPVRVANDGDVAALAGRREGRSVLGVSLGSSEAGGFVRADDSLDGRLVELAFVPVDASPRAAMDEWSGDIGCGVNYLSQQGLARLAEAAGFCPEPDPAARLDRLRESRAEDPAAREIFGALGETLGHSLAYYAEFLRFDDVLLLGGVLSGPGGETVRGRAAEVLAECYPELRFALHLPKTDRGLAQCLAAARL